ncbi:MAG: hypothetical protein ACREYE_04470 [Gammaproteobacteria bacterium]
MSETIAITGKSVKLFKGHYTRTVVTGFYETTGTISPEQKAP